MGRTGAYKAVATRNAIGAKMLHNAYLHLSRSCNGLENVRAAQDILMEAERYVNNYFKMPSKKYWDDSIDTIFRLWPGSRG